MPLGNIHTYTHIKKNHHYCYSGRKDTEYWRRVGPAIFVVCCTRKVSPISPLLKLPKGTFNERWVKF